MTADPSVPQRVNPSTDAYERARKVVRGWLSSLHPDVARGIPEDDGGQLLDSVAWEIDAAVVAHQTDPRSVLVAKDALEAAARLARDLEGVLGYSMLASREAWGNTNVALIEERLDAFGLAYARLHPTGYNPVTGLENP